MDVLGGEVLLNTLSVKVGFRVGGSFARGGDVVVGRFRGPDPLAPGRGFGY